MILDQGGAVTGSPVAQLGVSAALDPETANEFARQAVRQGAGDHANVLKLYHRAEKPGVIELDGNEDQLEIAATVEDSWANGFDAIKFNNYTTPEGRKGASFILVKNPEQLRSVNAQFDPACGGRWNGDEKTWDFDPRDEDRVRDLCKEVYGPSGSPPEETSTYQRPLRHR